MSPTRRAQLTLAAVAIASGAVGLARARGSFANRSGSDIGYAELELHLMSFNRLGALLAFALGTIAFVGAFRSQRSVVAIAAIGFGAFAVQSVIGARRIDGGNITGANGATLSFCLMMAIGLGVLAWPERSREVTE